MNSQVEMPPKLEKAVALQNKLGLDENASSKLVNLDFFMEDLGSSSEEEEYGEEIF